MIRAIRPAAMAQDDAAMISGWNVAPNLAYTVVLLPGPASYGVLLYAEDGSTLIATGAALVGTVQPCILIPQSGQTIEMVDADLGWHIMLTTTGTESQRTIRIGPAVDLPDEIHPVYGDDALALARATAAIDAAAHYIDDVTVTCPLGLGAGLGDVVSVPVDGVAVVGQVESITWTATPDGTMEQAVIRRHVAIAPEAFADIAPPTVADDTGTATHLAGTSGNVLTNDATGLTVTAVNGMSGSVGTAVDGDNGGTFTIAANGAWTFSPAGDFALLSGAETADTSVTYHASNGAAEAMATLTVTVSRANAAPVAVDDAGETTADATTSGNVLTNDTDADADGLTVSRVNGSAGNIGVAVAGSGGGVFTIGSTGAWAFDPDGDFSALTGTQTATTSVTYHVSDGLAEDEGVLTVTVSAASAPANIALVVYQRYWQGNLNTPNTFTLPDGILPGDLVFIIIASADTSATDRNLYATGYVEVGDWIIYDTRSCNLGVFYKVMGDTVDTQVVVNGVYQSYNYGMLYEVFVFRGVNTDSPLDVTPTVASAASSVSVNSPPITPVTDRALVFSIAAVAGHSATNGATPAMTVLQPSGFDLLAWEALNGGGAYVTMAGVASKLWRYGDGVIDPSGWSGVASNNVSYSSWIGVTLALRPM